MRKITGIFILILFLSTVSYGVVFPDDSSAGKIVIFSTTNTEKDVSQVYKSLLAGSNPTPGTLMWSYNNTPFQKYNMNILFKDLTGRTYRNPGDLYSFWSLKVKSTNKIDNNLSDDAGFVTVGDVLDQRLLSLTPEIVGFDAPVSGLKYTKIPFIIVMNEEGKYLHVEMILLVPNKTPFITRGERIINPDTGTFNVKKPEVDFNYVTKNWKKLYLYGYRQFASVSNDFFHEYLQRTPLWEESD